MRKNQIFLIIIFFIIHINYIYSLTDDEKYFFDVIIKLKEEKTKDIDYKYHYNVIKDKWPDTALGNYANGWLIMNDKELGKESYDKAKPYFRNAISKNNNMGMAYRRLILCIEYTAKLMNDVGNLGDLIFSYCIIPEDNVFYDNPYEQLQGRLGIIENESIIRDFFKKNLVVMPFDIMLDPKSFLNKKIIMLGMKYEVGNNYFNYNFKDSDLYYSVRINFIGDEVYNLYGYLDKSEETKDLLYKIKKYGSNKYFYECMITDESFSDGKFTNQIKITNIY
ncbi:MAG: hypothetical protein KA885_08330 [Spirochaetes bacterium]|nr:hypothetical protein [Spirochaetota bacterium]